MGTIHKATVEELLAVTRHSTYLTGAPWGAGRMTVLMIFQHLIHHSFVAGLWILYLHICVQENFSYTRPYRQVCNRSIISGTFASKSCYVTMLQN
jgi:hypothetical protein